MKTEALLALPVHLRKRLAQALESGLLGMPCALVSLQSVLGLREGGEEVVAALSGLERLGVSGPAAAAWIRSLEEIALRARRPGLVRTGGAGPAGT